MVRKQSDRFFIQTWYDIIYNVYIYIYVSLERTYTRMEGTVLYIEEEGARLEGWPRSV